MLRRIVEPIVGALALTVGLLALPVLVTCGIISGALCILRNPLRPRCEEEHE